MKVVILAGGLGTRMGQETSVIPKPMVDIGGKPIIWHIIKYYTHFGHKEFVICLGYKGEVIRDYFRNYGFNNSDITISSAFSGEPLYRTRDFGDWCVTLVNTGLDTTTGGRIKKTQKYIGNEKFLLTYGDGLSDVNVNDLVNAHNISNSVLTITAVHPPGRFGAIKLDDSGLVHSFLEKPKDDVWINGGYMVASPQIFEYLTEDGDYLEGSPIETLVAEGKLSGFSHSGFWMAMDTPKDRMDLEKLWNSGKAPWKVWNE